MSAPAGSSRTLSVSAFIVGVYALLALASWLTERAGVIRCHCSGSCWCQRSALAPFRWVFPWGHR